MPDYRIDPFPPEIAMRGLWRRAWGEEGPERFADILERSLVHVGAFEGDELIGFVNVAWDGGQHAFLLDTCVLPVFRRRGVATKLVNLATDAARSRGVTWLHVDFEPHLTAFYRVCGFSATAAGLIRLKG
ncbi:N-acetyltransferase [Devosia pacifica]|uniref:N-acetyltransferase n=1 Tax=Devosia pacifica TaxID=1335967 RepID=A0A918RZ06_9HYPH|nr:GNAT family N-acetyltransferase [Devosia pacifica]GHA16816.1 N-acetyltransferase [Devosia pacifica]